VFLYNPHHKRFVRMMGDNVNGGGGEIEMDALPAAWDSERFVIVNAGGGEIALHNATHRRFVRLIGKDVEAKGGEKAVNELPADWDSERFTLVRI
jgi:hypothetical protein